MELFKSSGDPVRLASTSGHVVFVGKDWTPVPEPLVTKALAARCIAKSVFDDVVASIRAEDKPEPEVKVDIPAIQKALSRINGELVDGKTETEGGNVLQTARNQPGVEAVCEYCGFQVTRADIATAIEQL